MFSAFSIQPPWIRSKKWQNSFNRLNIFNYKNQPIFVNKTCWLEIYKYEYNQPIRSEFQRSRRDRHVRIWQKSFIQLYFNLLIIYHIQSSIFACGFPDYLSKIQTKLTVVSFKVFFEIFDPEHTLKTPCPDISHSQLVSRSITCGCLRTVHKWKYQNFQKGDGITMS